MLEGFACKAVNNNLEIRNWSGLWTREHLEKRLLEPLEGVAISLSPDQCIATLHFDGPHTAQRAELICR
jgi:hypothetical protein